MSLVTDTGRFTDKVDFALGASIASATTPDINSASGNTVYITGTTTITGFSAAIQAGVTRRLIFNNALILTNGANLVLFGGANITTVAGDVAVFMAKTNTIWEMVSFFRPSAYTNGQFDGDAILAGSVTAAKLGDEAVIPSKTKAKYITAQADADDTITADEMLGGIFTITPTAARALTTDTGANILGSLTGYQAGTSYEFTIVNQAAFNVTLTAGANVSITGSAVVNNGSATFLVRAKDATDIQIFRK